MRSSRDKGPYKRCSEDGQRAEEKARQWRDATPSPGRPEPQKLDKARKDPPPPPGASRRHPSSMPGLCCAWTGGGRACGNGPSPTGQWPSDFTASPTRPPGAGLLLRKLRQDPTGSEGPGSSRPPARPVPKSDNEHLTVKLRAASDSEQPRLSGAWWPCSRSRLFVAWQWVASGKTGSCFCEAGEGCPGSECRRRAVSCSRKMTEGFSDAGGITGTRAQMEVPLFSGCDSL